MTQAIDLAIAEIGTLEWAQGSNPKVMAYYKDAGFAGIKGDDVAWCAAFVGAMLKRAGIKPSGSLLARSYLKWGNHVPLAKIQRGDIGVIARGEPWQGHVFIIEEVRGKTVLAVNGNVRDSVCRSEYPISSLLGVRRAVAVKPDALPLSPKPVVASPAPQTVAKPSFFTWLLSLFKGPRA